MCLYANRHGVLLDFYKFTVSYILALYHLLVTDEAEVEFVALPTIVLQVFLISCD